VISASGSEGKRAVASLVGLFPGTDGAVLFRRHLLFGNHFGLSLYIAYASWKYTIDDA
jgi:hypothetical protein